MISISLLLVLALATNLTPLTTAKKTEDQCVGEYEFWGCQSSTRECQRLCEFSGSDRRKLKCKPDCEKACVCEAGYLRNGSDGECVYETECPNFNHETGKLENDNKTKSGQAKNNKTGSNLGEKLAKAKSQAKPKPKRFIDSEDDHYDENDTNEDYEEDKAVEESIDIPSQPDYEIAIGGVEYPD